MNVARTSRLDRHNFLLQNGGTRWEDDERGNGEPPRSMVDLGRFQLGMQETYDVREESADASPVCSMQLVTRASPLKGPRTRPLLRYRRFQHKSEVNAGRKKMNGGSALYVVRIVLAAFSILLAFSSIETGSAVAYTHSFTVRRVVAAPVDITYRACVRGWCAENLGLPLPPPLVWRTPSDPRTGRGLILLRVPPAGLKEGIVDARLNEWIQYSVLNPGWLTWPVHDHQGRIELRPAVGPMEDDAFRGNGLPHLTDNTLLEWTVDFTPFAPGNRWWCDALLFVTRAIIERAVEHVAYRAEDAAADDGVTE